MEDALMLVSFSLILLLPLSLIFFLSLIVRPHPMKVPIKGRHVFITGGSSGIGLELAKRAAIEGARVSILARNQKKLEDAKDSIRLATGIDVSIFSADVRDMESVRKAIDEAGPIDVLICNQGFFVARELVNQDLEEVKFIIDVNLIGTFHLIKAALPGMKARRDKRPVSIAIMSSQAGQVGIYGYSAYSASKFGLRGMAEVLQQELIAYNIHITLIYPPDTNTPGLVEQNKTRPALTSIIAASSGAMESAKVAKISMDGIKSAKFNVFCNFEGWMLGVVCAGLSPQRSYIMAFFEVVFASILRLVGLCFQWNWYQTILKWHAKNINN
ncbi:3-dehydrosphinganine reductase TSC10A-like [Impatiens glandulifera]|uniref:3-dehydrosphinganine reductase TSC10A-like n=1 Tax=Impatiens glandulifera TaxID=253017 RepID=UPI001FB15FB3|nr:3-dehydrosphinganine reductase TSC10A-like [Impatiens glandulifera]